MHLHFATARAFTTKLRSAAVRGIVAASLLATGLLVAPASPVDAVVANPDAPMILQGLQLTDLVHNTHGVCNGNFNYVIKNEPSSTTTTALRNYLNAAQACGLKVIFSFTNTVVSGHIYTARVPYWVNKVKTHPALAGYLSVKEPSWNGVSAAEIRALYRAYHAADPNHPVYALFGDIPHFGLSANPYTAGMADVVMVDWYPVETGSRGCSRSGTTYVSGGPTYYKRIYAKVHAVKASTPIIAMLQTHKYLGPTCHKKQLPTKSLLWRQAREALVYGHVAGLAFHTWTNTSYQMDEKRNTTMVGYMKQLSLLVRSGTFQ
jgi:hypothetical protein